VEEKILELVEEIRKLSNDNTTSVNVFINCQEHVIKIKDTTAEQLKSDGVSMRNLKGAFIGAKK